MTGPAPTSGAQAVLNTRSLATTALTDAAVHLDPRDPAAWGWAAAATPPTQTTAAVRDEDQMVADLAVMLDGPDPIGAFRDYAVRTVTDAEAYVVFLRAAYRALLTGVDQCTPDLDQGRAALAAIAEVLAPFAMALSAELSHLAAPGTALYVLAMSAPGALANAQALIHGILQGMADSHIISVENLLDLVTAGTVMTALMPVHATLFIVGTIYQLLRDVYDTVSTIVGAVGYLDEVVPLFCRLVQAAPVALGRLLDAESAGDVGTLGRYLGQALGGSLQQSVPQLTSAATYSEIATELAEFSFTCGTWFGPLLVDILLPLTGIGMVEAGLRVLGRVATIAPDVLQWLFAVLRRLLDAVDPGLVDDLAQFGATLGARLTQRLGEIAAEGERPYGVAQETIERGLAVVEQALGRERYASYASGIFCGLEP